MKRLAQGKKFGDAFVYKSETELENDVKGMREEYTQKNEEIQKNEAQDIKEKAPTSSQNTDKDVQNLPILYKELSVSFMDGLRSGPLKRISNCRFGLPAFPTFVIGVKVFDIKKYVEYEPSMEKYMDAAKTNPELEKKYTELETLLANGTAMKKIELFVKSAQILDKEKWIVKLEFDDNKSNDDVKFLESVKEWATAKKELANNFFRNQEYKNCIKIYEKIRIFLHVVLEKLRAAENYSRKKTLLKEAAEERFAFICFFSFFKLCLTLNSIGFKK